MRARFGLGHVRQLDRRAEELRTDDLPGGRPAACLVAKGFGPLERLLDAVGIVVLAPFALARNLPQDKVQAFVAEMTQDRFLGVLGEKRVNVLKLNLALDQLR